MNVDSTVVTSTNFNIEFSEEEKAILKQASYICEQTCREISIQDDGDNDVLEEYGSFFIQMSENINNILKGIYRNA